MSNSKLIDKTILANSANYMQGRNGSKIKAVTVHHMGAVLTIEECGNVFKNPDRKASSHYGIGSDGRVALYVNEKDTAYTNSNFESNKESVTIEVSNSKASGDYPVSDKALEKLILLVADIAKRNNLGKLVKGKNLTWHNMYTATACPGKYLLSKLDYIILEANKINGIDEENSGESRKSNEEIADEVIMGLWGNGKERKDRLTAAGYDYYAIQNIVNEKLLGKKTNEQIAKEVIQGKWGNGKERKERLTAAGYDYYAVQKIVNEMLLG